MPLTLVTTAGAASANAYCDRAFVATIADGVFPRPDGWYLLDDDEQARVIVQLTRRIDQEHLRGERATDSQALAFPRREAPNVAETGYESDAVVPGRVQQAVAYGAVALAQLVARGEADPMAPSEFAGLTSVSLGSEFSASFAGAGVALSDFERMIATVVRPILGTLCLSPQLRTARG